MSIQGSYPPSEGHMRRTANLVRETDKFTQYVPKSGNPSEMPPSLRTRTELHADDPKTGKLFAKAATQYLQHARNHGLQR